MTVPWQCESGNVFAAHHWSNRQSRGADDDWTLETASLGRGRTCPIVGNANTDRDGRDAREATWPTLGAFSAA